MTESSRSPLSSSLSPIDVPLTDPSQDLLGRSQFARGLAQGILQMDAENGFVVALHGPWGSGKSTTLNFVLHHIDELSSGNEKPLVVRFNPWWFAGQEQMLLRFFGQMRAAFRRKDNSEQLYRIGATMESFANALTPLAYIPVAESFAEPLKQILGSLGGHIRKTGEHNRADVMQLRETIDRLLAGQPRKVLVVIDDIDRLSAEEVRMMFQLVKAVANFPKTIYLLAFDRNVVARALDKAQPGHGDAYLEKIVQVPFNLPYPERQSLYDLFFAHLDLILNGTPDDLWERTYWGNVFLDGIAPFLRNLRDVKRLLNSLQISYPMVKGEVNAVDFVAIESLRVFVPTMWAIVRDNPSIFAGSADLPVQYDPTASSNLDAKRELLESFVESGTAEATREATGRLLYRLFPLYALAFGGAHYGPEWARQWRMQRKVCSPEAFPVYFQLGVARGAMTLAEFRSIVALADDRQALIAALGRLANELMPDGQTSRIYGFIFHLEDFAREPGLLPDKQVSSIVQAIYDAGDSILEAKLPARMFDIPKEWRLDFVINALLARLPRQERYQTLYDVFTRSRSVQMVAYGVSFFGQEYGRFRANPLPPEQRSISEEQLAELETIALERIEQAADDGVLDSASNLLRVLYVWEELAQSDQPPREFVDALVRSDRGMLRFLSNCLTQMFSSGMSDRIPQSSWVLDISTVAKWTDPYALQDRAKTMLQQQTHWLNDEEKLAIETFLRELEHAPHGYDDLGLPKEVEANGGQGSIE